MLITDFDFELPDELIAQEPLKNREKSRMLSVNRASKSFWDEHFYDFPKFLKKGDVIEEKLFFPVAMGITCAITAFILGL